ncbi:hypothetical protein [Halioglobus japonicus]|uniref:hypothetical protein n=1 Tax=Halioglobus japonicus TaxID=930805 RepID=UPI0011AFBA55|nr:hypothetical protein [Halioglobus japonicus]
MQISQSKAVVGLVLAIWTGIASAATYETVITWTPDTANFPDHSDDAAYGDRAVISWSTDLSSGSGSGSGSSADIIDLRVDLYGNGVLIQTDRAVINTIVQPLPDIGVGREDLPLDSAVDLDFDPDNAPSFLTYVDTARYHPCPGWLEPVRGHWSSTMRSCTAATLSAQP